MKKLRFLLAFSFILIPLFQGFAAQTLPKSMDEDKFFYDGVFLYEIDSPEDLDSTSGTSEGTINGTGAVVIGRSLPKENQKTGGMGLSCLHLLSVCRTKEIFLLKVNLSMPKQKYKSWRLIEWAEKTTLVFLLNRRHNWFFILI